jgi:hypothetical protein
VSGFFQSKSGKLRNTFYLEVIPAYWSEPWPHMYLFPMLPLLYLRSFCSVQVAHRVYFDKTTAKADTLVASLCTTPSMKLELNLLHFPRFLSSVKCEGTKENIDVVTDCMMNPL